MLHIDDSLNITIPNYALDSLYPFSNGILLVAHEHNRIPPLQSSGVVLSPGKFTTLHIQQTRREQLPWPYSDCSEDPTFVEGIPLDGTVKYSDESCAEFCIQQRILDECGCISGKFMIHEVLLQNASFCEIVDDSDIGTQITDYFNSDGCVVFTAFDAQTGCYDKCKEPCLENRYTMYTEEIDWPHPALHMAIYRNHIARSLVADRFTEYKDLDDSFADGTSGNLYHKLNTLDLMTRSLAQVSVRFETMTVVKYTDQSAVSVAQLMGTLGGTLNLWVGISFITIIELLELLYHLLTHCTGHSHKGSMTKVQPISPTESSKP